TTLRVTCSTTAVFAGAPAGTTPFDTGMTPMPPLNLRLASSAFAGDAETNAASDSEAAMAATFMSRTSRVAGWTAPGEHFLASRTPTRFCDTQMKRRPGGRLSCASGALQGTKKFLQCPAAAPGESLIELPRAMHWLGGSEAPRSTWSTSRSNECCACG